MPGETTELQSTLQSRAEVTASWLPGLQAGGSDTADLLGYSKRDHVRFWEEEKGTAVNRKHPMSSQFAPAGLLRVPQVAALALSSSTPP